MSGGVDRHPMYSLSYVLDPNWAAGASRHNYLML